MKPHSSPPNQQPHAVLKFLGKATNWQQALRVFGGLPHKDQNVKTFGAAIGACASSGEWELAHLLLRELLHHTHVQGNAIAYSSAIRACKPSGAWQQANVLLGEMATKNVERNLVTYNIALSVMENVPHKAAWHAAFRMLEVLREDTLQGDIFTCSSLISSSLRNTAWHTAVLLWRLAPAAVQPDYIFWSSVFNACAFSGAWSSAVFFLGELRKQRPRDRMVSKQWTMLYNLAINAFSSCGQEESHWQRALSLLQGLGEAQGEASIVTYGSIVSVCADCEGWQCALALVQHLDDQELKLDLVTCSSAICACRKQPQKATAMLRGLPTRKLEADVISYNAAIQSCSAWASAESMLRELQQDAVEPSTRSYPTVLRICEHSAAWHRAVLLLEEHVERLRTLRNPTGEDREGLLRSFNIAISCCQESHLWKQALLILQLCMNISKPSVVSFSSAISACEKSGQWPQSLALLRHMETALLDANTIACNAAIGSCEKSGQWQIAEALFQEICQASDIEADRISYNSCMSVLATAAQWRRALVLFGELGSEADDIAYSLVMRAAQRASKWEVAQVFVDMIAGLSFCARPRFHDLNPKLYVNICDFAAATFDQAGQSMPITYCLEVVQTYSLLELREVQKGPKGEELETQPFQTPLKPARPTNSEDPR